MLKLIRKIHDDSCQDSPGLIDPTPKRKRLSTGTEQKKKKQDPQEIKNADASPMEEELLSVRTFKYKIVILHYNILFTNHIILIV